MALMSGAMKAAGRPSLHFGSMTFAWTQASSFVDDGVEFPIPLGFIVQKFYTYGIIVG